MNYKGVESNEEKRPRRRKFTGFRSEEAGGVVDIGEKKSRREEGREGGREKGEDRGRVEMG